MKRDLRARARWRWLLTAAFAVAALLAAWLGGQAAADEAGDAYRQGNSCLDREDFDQAIVHLSRAIALNPKHTAALLARGWAYSERNDFDKAIADFTAVIRLAPKNADAWCNRGQIVGRRGNLDAALPDLNEAIRLNPKLTEAYLARGWVYAEKSAWREAIADYSAGIRLAPKDPQPYFDRATCRAAQHRYAEAIADLDRAIERRPQDARFYGARGAAYLHQREYARGRADLQAAIRLNPHDAGRDYRASGETQLSADALEHGKAQVRRMVSDRPAMGEFGEESDFLRQWAARKFAGEDLGEPCDWDPTPPRDSDAENVAPTAGRRACLRVEPLQQSGPQRGAPRSFEELWAGAVFELHNITYCRQFLRLYQQAAQGALTKEQFVAEIWKYEYIAAQRTRGFYVDVFLPWVAKKKLTTDPGLWFAAWWSEADEALQSFTDRTAYPWRPYARQFDWLTVPRLYGQQQYAGALTRLRHMQAERQYTHDTAAIHLWIARCRLGLGSPRDALASLDEAVRLDPNSADAFRLRAEAYRRMGENEKAAADSAQARALEGKK